ncbi:MAG: prepilin-type N-terminal cleavage/methylation domain-containing protein [Candidatus Staskawiczbacteria bacterium]|nr:prepilin-type N-terminal cleavage/methylation domain-containing protein [Candidatus Staskawiczbacteria bacterium]
MQKQKGFTIIELIVVIAIIAVLAAIVMVNVTNYIAKSKDSATKGNMHSMVVDSIKYYDVPAPTYAGLCGDNATGFADAYSAITAVKSCNAVFDKWCACSASSTDSSKWFCVDQKAQVRETLTNCNTASYCGSNSNPVCP